MTAEASSTATRRRIVLALVLALLTFGLYWPVGSFEFLNYDDPDYVTANAVVARGLSAEGLHWAFGYQAANWHPLTWLSHMLDVELFGLDAGAHHRVNAGLHALNAALLFLALAALTRRTAASLIVAALFAVHPVRVQSVAWIAERKDLLAGTFFLALLWAHAGHARRPRVGTMALLVACLALGCMAKPMLVTAPFVLLLLDAWPLGRWRGTRPDLGAFPPGAPAHETPSLAPTRPGETLGPRSGFVLVLEKVPLLLVALVCSVLTWQAQRAGGALGSLEGLGLGQRFWSACAGYAAYLRSTLWPGGWAAFHPHPALVGGALVVPGLIGLGLVTLGSALAWRWRRCCPAVAVGWAWFLGMLVPVIGLVQVGDQAWAERYAYLPTIGLLLALVFPLAERARTRPALTRPLAGAAALVVLALAGLTWRALPAWRDSRALFEQALAATTNNWIAHNNLGLVFLERRDLDRASEHFEAASAIRPSFVQAQYNLGLTREAQQRFLDAITSYRRVLELEPGHPQALLRLAALARAEGNFEQARAYLEQGTRANPRNGELWLARAEALLAENELDRAANCAQSALSMERSLVGAEEVLAEIALRRGEIDEGLARIASALEREPQRATALALQARLYMRRGERAAARQAFERSLAIDPQQPAARFDLGALLLGEAAQQHDDPAAANRAREAARGQFQSVLDLRPGDPEALAALAAMQLEEGRLEAAIAGLRQALERRPDFPTAWSNLGLAYERQERWAEAIEAYGRAAGSGAPSPDTARALAWLLATCPDETLCDGERAVGLATVAARAQDERALEVLAAAQARKGDFEAAVELQAVAIERLPRAQRAEAEARLALYRAKQPYTRPR